METNENPDLFFRHSGGGRNPVNEKNPPATRGTRPKGMFDKIAGCRIASGMTNF